MSLTLIVTQSVSICNTIIFQCLKLPLLVVVFGIGLTSCIYSTVLALILLPGVRLLVVIEGRGRFSASHRRFRCRDFLYANRAALNIDTYILLSGGPAALNNDTNRPHFLFCTIFRPPLAKNISENFENS